MTGKRARIKVGNMSRRIIDQAHDVQLSPAPVSGPVRAATPSLPEQGFGSPSQVLAKVAGATSFSPGPPSWGVSPILSLPLVEPVVVYSSEGSQNGGASVQSNPAVG